MNGFLRGTLIFLSIILIVILLSIRLNSQATLTKVLAKMEQFCSIKENSCEVGNYIMTRDGRVYTFVSEVDKYRVVTIKSQKDGSLYVSKSVEGEY